MWGFFSYYIWKLRRRSVDRCLCGCCIWDIHQIYTRINHCFHELKQATKLRFWWRFRYPHAEEHTRKSAFQCCGHKRGLKTPQQLFLQSVSILWGTCRHKIPWCVNTGLYPVRALLCSRLKGRAAQLNSTACSPENHIRRNFWSRFQGCCQPVRFHVLNIWFSLSLPGVSPAAVLTTTCVCKQPHARHRHWVICRQDVKSWSWEHQQHGMTMQRNMPVPIHILSPCPVTTGCFLSSVPQAGHGCWAWTCCGCLAFMHLGPGIIAQLPPVSHLETLWEKDHVKIGKF